MGRLWRATPPMMTMTSDSTVAKTGRSTKKRAHAHEEPRRQQPVRIGQHRPHVNRAGGRVDLVVDEVDRTLVAEVVLVSERDEDGRRGRADVLGRGGAVARDGAPPEANERALIGVEVH